MCFRIKNKNMSQISKRCIYNKNHSLTIIDKHKGQIFERTLNINISKCDDSLQVKISDPLDYSFSYSDLLTPAVYDTMRVNQNLDINFTEFKTNLLEMLQQFQDKELYLKCELSENICTMIFYGRSKIKTIIFLTVDLHATNQKEILDELIRNMQEIQDFNEKLKKQLSLMKSALNEKDQEIRNMDILKVQSEGKLFKHLEQLEKTFNIKSRELEYLLVNKLDVAAKRVFKLLNDVDLLKQDSVSKTQASAKLHRLMENMKIESRENSTAISRLEAENNILKSEKVNIERCIDDLKRALHEKEMQCNDFQKKNEELHSDLRKATIIITQKKSTNEELSQDLIQANQMLVNFNKHYDDKVKMIEDLEKTLELKEKVILDERKKYQDFMGEFDRYKQIYNSSTQETLTQELSIMTNKIIDLEKTIRKLNKINTLLTEKVNEFGFPHNKRT